MTIESANRVHNHAACLEHTGAVQEEYVLLSVKDTGSGMSPRVMKNLFDPLLHHYHG